MNKKQFNLGVIQRSKIKGLSRGVNLQKRIFHIAKATKLKILWILLRKNVDLKIRGKIIILKTIKLL